MQQVTSKIIEIDSNKPGPVLAIFAGVHGNETAGVIALQKLLPQLSILRGKIKVAFANPPAIQANVRMINKNLNRCFIKNNDGNSPEDVRARELMAVLDQCDALLDLHMFYDETGVPFVICEENALDLAQKFDVDIISTNWTKVEPGATDGYMFLQGKVGVCVECGPISKAEEFTEFAIRTIYQFLGYYNVIDSPEEFSVNPKRLIKAERAVLKASPDFVLSSGLRNFDRLESNQLLARDGGVEYRAGKNECIIFPHYDARVKEEAYIIGIEKTA